MDEKKLIGVLVPISMRISNEEGITDEQASIIRANQIIDDAKKDAPETEVGQRARLEALEIIAVKDTQDAGRPPKFDYEKYRNEHAILAIEQILKKIGEHAAFLPIPTKTSPEYEKNCEEAYEKLSLDTFQALNTHQVGMSEYKFVFDSLKAVISALEENIMNQIVGHRHEIMSRQFGTKNPGTDKFDANYATYETLITTLEKIRLESGGKLDDYFTISPKE